MHSFLEPPDFRVRATVRWGIAPLVGLALLLGPSHARAEDPRAAVTRLTEKYAAELTKLAAWCDEKGLKAEAEQTRARFKPRDPNKIYVSILPEAVGPPKPPDGASADVLTWRERFDRLRREQAETLFGMARGAVRNRHPSLAFDLALAAIGEDPDNEAVRRLLGYQKFQDGWHTAYEVRRLHNDQIWSDRFGWIRKADLKRYEEGQRPYNGRWISAEEDAKLHHDIQNGWDIETEHYTVRTDHSIEAGVALGAKLEQLYRVWKQLFVPYYATEQQVIALFDPRGRAKLGPLPRHQVVYFRDREDYNRSLSEFDPKIGISIGVYVDQTRRAYFFAGDDYDERTMYHEATHQLFHESRPVAPNVGLKANCWVVEGIALYMESLRQEDGYWVLGGLDDVRAKAARSRLLQDQFFVPTAELTMYSFPRLQSDPRIRTLYSQMAGLATFFVHYQGGQYRDALLAYLTAVYNGNQNPRLLSQLTDVAYPDLDKQYREFMEKNGQ